MTMRRTLGATLAALLAGPALAAGPLQVNAGLLQAAPVIDGRMGDWKSVPPTQVTVVQLTPAVKDDTANTTGPIDVDLRVGVHGEYLYLAARWPDRTEDRTHRPWTWAGGKYVRGKERDDMFAARFHIDGDFDGCMLSNKDYRVDVWVWSAGRSDSAGHAEDMMHVISQQPIEDAAEHEGPKGQTVYIKKTRDAGDPVYAYTRAPKDRAGDEVGSVLPGRPSGSAGDVEARAVWNQGYWNLEMRRKLDTGQADDARFVRGAVITGNIAVFNKGYDQHKSVSTDLAIRLP